MIITDQLYELFSIHYISFIIIIMYVMITFLSELILEAMDYAVYKDDVKHIILDNLQVRKKALIK